MLIIVQESGFGYLLSFSRQVSHHNLCVRIKKKMLEIFRKFIRKRLVPGLYSLIRKPAVLSLNPVPFPFSRHFHCLSLFGYSKQKSRKKSQKIFGSIYWVSGVRVSGHVEQQWVVFQTRLFFELEENRTDQSARSIRHHMSPLRVPNYFFNSTDFPQTLPGPSLSANFPSKIPKIPPKNRQKPKNPKSSKKNSVGPLAEIARNPFYYQMRQHGF